MHIPYSWTVLHGSTVLRTMMHYALHTTYYALFVLPTVHYTQHVQLISIKLPYVKLLRLKSRLLHHKVSPQSHNGLNWPKQRQAKISPKIARSAMSGI